MNEKGELNSGPANQRKDIFLLTKPPHSDRARLCLRLIAQSEDAVLYLAGDGVYNLLGEAPIALPREGIVACREDLQARGVPAEGRATVPVDFYELLVDDVMSETAWVYTF
jgi:tRNA 2-thiouridine synthesizing protein B